MTGKREHTFVLSGDSGIKSAQDVAERLRQTITKHGHINVDTQAMSGADITTVQLLLAARATAEASNKTMRMLAPLGAPLQQVLAAAGFLAPEANHVSFWTPVTE